MYQDIDKNQYTPMMRQYLEIKEEYADALVFFRLGDFYEMFFNDAIVASKELDIVLTGRDAGSPERVPMCGVPFHSVGTYLDKLTEKGYKVAIVEQVEDPALAKGLVRREVVRVVTPGTVTEGEMLDARDNNYLVAVSAEKERFLLAYCDLSTGENYLTELPPAEELLAAELLKLNTREVVVPPGFNRAALTRLASVHPLAISEEEQDGEVTYLRALATGLAGGEARTFWRLINYVIRTQKRTLVHLQPVVRYDSSAYMKIDFASRRNLELTETLRFQERRNTLLSVLDKCSTAMGSRYLKKSLLFPLLDKEKIEHRFDVIDRIAKAFLEASDLKKTLDDVYDLERIAGRLSYETAGPRDLLQLECSLAAIPKICELLAKMKIAPYFDLESERDRCRMLAEVIAAAISPDAPLYARDGNVIKPGYHAELDELRAVQDHSKDYLLALEQREREKTGIKTLRVGYNRVFGYYIEVSKGASDRVRDEFGYIRKQTLSNTERFITSELKDMETKILQAAEKELALELELFTAVRDQAKQEVPLLQRLARIIAELDMILAFARVAKENNYVRPRFTDNHEIEIKNLRHPVMELASANFIPNDVKMGPDDGILLITGPNMGGKSTYMRQVALAAIMAQIGSFVACDRARLPLFDAIFTRIGVADDIISGQSTFMVEMTEVNKALTRATKDSLIILDEIGRGTATYDGMALAQAIIEFIDAHIGCKTLFSTHYHELTALAESIPRLKNVHVAAEEVAGDIVFLYKVCSGAADKSYGINVAKLASLPLPVILRATDILNKLETQKPDARLLSVQNYQPPLLFDSKTEKETLALEELKQLDLYNMSPIAALAALEKLQKLLKK